MFLREFEVFRGTLRSMGTLHPTIAKHLHFKMQTKLEDLVDLNDIEAVLAYLKQLRSQDAEARRAEMIARVEKS